LIIFASRNNTTRVKSISSVTTARKKVKRIALLESQQLTQPAIVAVPVEIYCNEGCNLNPTTAISNRHTSRETVVGDLVSGKERERE
jgi:hypothetical protein